jgi:uncharacterized membrane protein YkvA (DUF1232 family)
MDRGEIMGQEDFYHRLRERVREWARSEQGKNSKWAEYVLLVPDFFHLICKLALDDEVGSKDKAKLAVVIAYFVSPADAIPEGLVGPIGYVDDLALTAYVLNQMVQNNPEPVKRNWAGEEDVIAQIKEILRVADEMLGSGLWQKIKSMFN